VVDVGSSEPPSKTARHVARSDNRYRHDVLQIKICAQYHSIVRVDKLEIVSITQN
jgi:hypothetical protein